MNSESFQSALDEILSSNPQLNLSLTHVMGDTAVAGGGGSCDVYRAKMYLGRTSTVSPLIRVRRLLAGTGISRHARSTHSANHVDVAIKRIRVVGELVSQPEVEKTVAKELGIWASLSHPNILLLLGIIRDFHGSPYPSFVSPWMEMGTLKTYMKGHPINILPMTCGIASGLEYLHSQGIIHADLKCANILLSSSLQPLLIDFGLSRQIMGSLSGKPSSTHGPLGTLQWMAPELLLSGPGEDLKPNKKTDIWAFGMTVLELITKQTPYPDSHSFLQMCKNLQNGILPLQPENMAQRPYVDQALWSLCNECWKFEASLRPTLSEIQESLITMKNSSPSKRIVVVDYQEEEVETERNQHTFTLKKTLVELSHLDLTHDIVENSSIFMGIGEFHDVSCSKMSKSWRPRSDPHIQSLLWLEEASDSTSVSIKRLKFWESSKNASVIVAVTRLRIWDRPLPIVEKAIVKELKMQAELSYPNVLPLLGYVLDWTGCIYPSMVVPQMENGTLRGYMTRDDVDIRVLMMAQGIISGLQYLHSLRVIHGDLKCENIVLSPTLKPLLTGFGYFRQIFADDPTSTWMTIGSLRWLAPELLEEEWRDKNEMSDVWAFGMTLLELLTRDTPYKGMKDSQVVIKLAQGYPPPPPSNLSERSATDQYLWAICQECWMMDPSQRPIAVEIQNKLYQVLGNEVT